MLAEILVSRKIGALHVKLVGASFRSPRSWTWLRSADNSPSIWTVSSTTTRGSGREDAYRAAWQAAKAVPVRERRKPVLGELAAALAAAAEGIAEFARAQGVEVQLLRFAAPQA
ncbi:hypothetical protein ABT247_08415 [Kitasatospora sp. NPDC001539]|uniref:hypothetical protein n=1 Tax=Kitasatospora sp. NPDC001539 TaxID=3154384 RepID=UPI00331A58DD